VPFYTGPAPSRPTGGAGSLSAARITPTAPFEQLEGEITAELLVLRIQPD